MPAFFKTVEKIKPVFDITEKIVMLVCKLLLIADIAITTYQVLNRYIPFIKGAAWTEEVILTCMSYMAVLAAALAIRKGTHIRMTAFDRYLPEKLVRVLDIVADTAVMVLGFIMLIEGWKYATTIGARGTYISMPSVSKIWMYMPVPVAGLAMIIFELEAIFQHLKAFFVKEGEK